jgi:hypothetical protein
LTGLLNRFISFLAVLIVFILAAHLSCSRQDPVALYFHDHGLTYPVDSSGLGIFGVEYVGVEEDEISAEGARDFVESGIIYIKGYFKKQKAGAIVKGAGGIVIEKPVLYRSEKGDVGIMVKVTAYGTGEPDRELKSRLSLMGTDKQMWKTQNFAYFFRNELYKWQFGGMVY